MTLEPGCYGDGALGYDHVRRKVAELVEDLVPSDKIPDDLLDTLRGEMSDDDWETTEALDLLNGYVSDNLLVGMRAGDLMVMPISWWSDE